MSYESIWGLCNQPSYIHWKPECDLYKLTKYFQITKRTFKKSAMLSSHHVCITVIPSTPSTGLSQSPSPSFASSKNQEPDFDQNPEDKTV